MTFGCTVDRCSGRSGGGNAASVCVYLSLRTLPGEQCVFTLFELIIEEYCGYARKLVGDGWRGWAAPKHIDNGG